MLQSITLQDFRNHHQSKFHFEKNKVVFLGPNGAGKTSALEAIMILILGKGWRESGNVEFIRDGGKKAPSAKIFGNFSDHIVREALLTPEKKILRENDKEIGWKQWMNRFGVVLFSPEMLTLFRGQKRDRVRFFDRFCSQLIPEYSTYLKNANQAHKQKTALLKYRTGKAEMQSWNTILAENVPPIVEIRKKILAEMTPLAREAVKIVNPDLPPVKLQLSVAENFSPTGDGVMQFLEENEERERVMKKNLVAPHRDDFLVFFGHKPITENASRGEERLTILSLLAAQKSMFEHQKGKAPFWLLDDVFSELDQKKQDHLIELCGDCPAFFTTTHHEYIKFFHGDIQVVELP